MLCQESGNTIIIATPNPGYATAMVSFHWFIFTKHRALVWSIQVSCLHHCTRSFYSDHRKTFASTDLIPERRKIATKVDGFKEKYKFPQCFGVLESSHISIVSPAD